MSTLTQSTVGWQAGVLQILPAVQTHAKIKFRRLPATTREESIQEAIAAAVVAYRRLAAQGRLHVAHPGTIATYAVKHVRNGRHVGGHQDAAKDVMSPACQRRRHVRVYSYHATASGTGTDGWRQITLADRRANIPDLAAFRIDFAEWLDAHCLRDQKIIAVLASGERTSAVAERFGISEARVSQLRRKYEQDWHTMQGDTVIAA